MDAADLLRASRGAAWRRGSTAARPSARAAGGRRWRGRWRRAAAGRPRAGPAACRPWPSSRTSRIASSTCGRISAFGTRAHGEAEADILAHASCAGRARSSGTPCRSRAAPAAALSMRRSSSQMAPLGQRQQAGDAVERRRLAAAGGPEERDELAARDRERDARAARAACRTRGRPPRGAARGSRPRRGPARARGAVGRHCFGFLAPTSRPSAGTPRPAPAARAAARPGRRR